MKRALVLILSLALVMCIAIPALAADDVVIYDFTNKVEADDSFGFNAGLAGMGFATPSVSIENGQMKMTFTGNSQTNAALGGYLNGEARPWVAELAKQAPNYKYIRLYLENKTPAAFALSIIFSSTESKIWGTPDMTKAVMINTKGEKVEVTVNSKLNGFTNGYIELPAGFEGWLFMETNVADFGLAPADWPNGNIAITSWSEVSQIEWDIRNVGDVAEGKNYMIWDDLALVNEAAAPEASEPGTNNPGNGGDISMLLYAAAAVSGLGALAIRRKK